MFSDVKLYGRVVACRYYTPLRADGVHSIKMGKTSVITGLTGVQLSPVTD
ncbi:MAG: hypothetical protein AB8B97_23670 [Granulosicoccus sp.]